jgi:biotin transporter BioY
VTTTGKHKETNDGIGLYTREQVKNTTPFQYFAQIVVGTVVFACGLVYLVTIFNLRSRETIQFGSPEPHLYGFLVAAAVIVVGIFMAHAGLIFWASRVRVHLKKRRQ